MKVGDLVRYSLSGMSRTRIGIIIDHETNANWKVAFIDGSFVCVIPQEYLEVISASR